mmetsp:Transcript_62157/g.145634  ORF Transcript_62157/g.145634 Transcript_62157/m.145634 type:complete len:115 (+) Transcript_62157:50-394(+)
MARIIFLVVLLPACAAITWVKSAGGASCDQTCAARAGCSEEVWPTSEEEFYDAAKSAGQVCEGTQTGGAKYDPSTDGRYCGWSGPEQMNSESRCSQSGDSGTYRFCPCNSDKEL